MTIDLSDKTIIITGAFGAIAEYVINTLIDAGAFVILTDLHADDEARRIMEQRNHAADRCDYWTMDVTDPVRTQQVLGEIFSKYPNVNVALGHAGGTTIHPFREMDAQTFDRIFDFNFKGQVHFTRPILRHWLENRIKGHMIYTSSFVSRLPWKGISAYTSAKAALDMFARNLALEHAPDGIRFNIISPGNVAAGSSLALYENDAQYRREVDAVSPLGHRNSPESIANGVLFLCSHLADEADGLNLHIDAGVGLPKLQQ